MRLYKTKIPEIAAQVIRSLNDAEDIEVLPSNRAESEMDLIAIMEEYLRRDRLLRDAVRQRMAELSLPYDQYSQTRSKMAQAWGHPLGRRVERYLAGQFVENFMISTFVEEVYSPDHKIRKDIISVLELFDVDEEKLREEAENRIKNVTKNTVEYEIRFAQALREVRKSQGLLD